jgi:hypothetical protein
VTGGEWALLIAAVFWALLVVVAAVLSISVYRVLGTTNSLLEGVRSETVPTIAEVRRSVTLANRELDRVDVILASTGDITRSVARITRLMDLLTTTPLVKAVSVSYGIQAALQRLRGPDR